MPNYTQNLNLFEYNLSTDGNIPFDVQKALNDNWDLLDAKVVRKTGDTMTGSITFDTRNTAGALIMKNTNFDWTNNKAEQQYPGVISFEDKNGQVARMDVFTPSTTLQVARIGTRNIATGTWAFLNVSVDNSGNTYCEFPKCTAKATTTSSASNSKVAVVTQNYLNGASWYRVWSDGWKEQGGKITGNHPKVTLLKNFSNTNYTAFAIQTGNGEYNSNVRIHTITTSSFIIYCNNYTGDKIWYACGY